MSGVYSVEDLLKLRASPLIRRPPNLPPIEEWMGISSQESTTKRPATTRGRHDDGSLQSEGFQKRPTLDPSMRKSTTDPERIVLGPPRRSFASSNARTFGRPGAQDSEDVQKEGVGRHERNKTGEEADGKFVDRRSGQYAGPNGRFGTRNDQDYDKLRRRQDDEDGEARARRDQDRPRWSRDDKAHEELDENGNIKSGFKRDPHARSRFEQSWLRNDRGTEEARRDTDRAGWRRDRPRDGEWDTPNKNDIDPEWMDSVDGAEPTQAHTQEDFQRWKERMKAAANGLVEERSEPVALAVPIPVESSKPPEGGAPVGMMSPDLATNSMDKFFAKFTEKRVATEEKGATTKPAAKSKFASLFGPPSEVKPDLPAVSAMPTMPTMPMIPMMPVSPAPAAPLPTVKSPALAMEHPGLSTEADQAGFKRILEMLGKRDATPVADASKPRPTSSSNEQHAQERHQSPDLVSLFKQTQPSRQTPVLRGPPGLEGLVPVRSPGEGHRRQDTPNKDELLLNLLRQAEISAKPTQQPQREFGDQRPPPGLFSSMVDTGRTDARQTHEERPEMDRPTAAQQSRGGNRSMFDDPAISNASYQNEIGPRQGSQRRPTNGYDDPYLDRLRQHEQQKPMQLPPGMPRPPGLEQMNRMPQGWPGQPPTHQQSRPGPPPGFSMPRGTQPPFGGPQQQPVMPPMPQQGQRPAQRKYTGESGVPNFPPGIGPPPGFMTNGPPPGFHHNAAAGQPQNYGRFAMGGEGQGPPQQGPPNMGRAFMEMYGNVERGGLRGGNGGVQLPPGFR